MYEAFGVTLETTAQIYSSHEGAKEWLSRVQAGDLAHGSDLVEALTGMTDNVRTADEILSLWYRDGLIEPVGKACPTASQQFMGHGGMWWKGHMKSQSALHPPCFHLFRKKRV